MDVHLRKCWVGAVGKLILSVISDKVNTFSTIFCSIAFGHSVIGTRRVFLTLKK